MNLKISYLLSSFSLVDPWIVVSEHNRNLAESMMFTKVLGKDRKTEVSDQMLGLGMEHGW